MITTYFKNLVADNLWKTAGATSLPSSYFLAMSSTEPLADGSGVTEPDSSTGYERIQISDLCNAVDGRVANNTKLSWPRFLLDAGTVDYWAIFDDTNNLVMGGILDSTKHLDMGTIVSIDAKSLILDIIGM